MKHAEIRHRLSEYIDGAITPGEKATIEEHLRTCTECSDALRELRKTIEHIHAVGEVESPAWLTQKIMAKVREEQEAKRNLWQRVFAPFLGKFPVQAVAVLFLAVTAFYLYSSINPAQKYTEEPVGMLAKKAAPAVDQMRDEGKAVREAAPEAKQAPRKPGYKSLDMKYAYETPAPPVPQDRQVAPAPPPEKEAERPTAFEEDAATGKRPAAPRTASPSLMMERAAPSAGAVRQTQARREASPEDRKAGKTLAADREADALLDVTEHFVKVDLPGTMKQKGLHATVCTKLVRDATGILDELLKE